jgi:hypothetical protein
MCFCLINGNWRPCETTAVISTQQFQMWKFSNNCIDFRRVKFDLEILRLQRTEKGWICVISYQTFFILIFILTSFLLFTNYQGGWPYTSPQHLPTSNRIKQNYVKCLKNICRNKLTAGIRWTPTLNSPAADKHILFSSIRTRVAISLNQ